MVVEVRGSNSTSHTYYSTISQRRAVMQRASVQLDAYYKIIDMAAEKSENLEISNRDAQHASYLIKTLFHYAEKEVCIFTGSLFEGVFGNHAIKEEAVKFLSKSPHVKLKVAFQEDISKEKAAATSFLQYILTAPDKKGMIEIYNASKAFPCITNHFLIADGKAFRYEIDHETRRAMANFGDTENAQVLSEIFNKIISESEKIAF